MHPCTSPEIVAVGSSFSRRLSDTFSFHGLELATSAIRMCCSESPVPDTIWDADVTHFRCNGSVQIAPSGTQFVFIATLAWWHNWLVPTRHLVLLGKEEMLCIAGKGVRGEGATEGFRTMTTEHVTCLDKAALQLFTIRVHYESYWTCQRDLIESGQGVDCLTHCNWLALKDRFAHNTIC